MGWSFVILQNAVRPSHHQDWGIRYDDLLEAYRAAAIEPSALHVGTTGATARERQVPELPGRPHEQRLADDDERGSRCHRTDWWHSHFRAQVCPRTGAQGSAQR